MTVLVIASVFSHRFACSQIPQLDCVVCTTCQESVKRIRITISAFIEHDSMSMPLMAITHNLDRFVYIGVIDYQFFVRPANQTYRRVSFRIMKAEGWYMLSSRVIESLYQLIKASLLQSLDIVFHFFI